MSSIAYKHLYLTHPDEALARVCDGYVELLVALLWRQQESPRDLLQSIAEKTIGLNLKALCTKTSHNW